MANILYFAYGSNLLRERLLTRCPNLSYAGRATLPGYRLAFDKVSEDGSGKCAIEAAQADDVFGVLWNVPEEDLTELDRAEGADYERHAVDIVMGEGRIVDAMTYDATKRQSGLKPYDWYLALVIAGAVQQGLADEYIANLRVTSFVVDTKLQRGTRRDALDALTQAGLMDEFDALTR